MSIHVIGKTQRTILAWLPILSLAACTGTPPATANAANVQATAVQAATSPVSATAQFPDGTELGDLGLPVYPTPPEHVSPHDAGTNDDGDKYDSVLLEPHDPFDTVVAWYKAHMPAGSFLASPDPKHAEFHLGDDDKITRTVIIDNVNEGQTHLILRMQTKP